jgi:hypothetical protein
MCRWVLYHGHEKILLADLLTRPKNGIVYQSNRVKAYILFSSFFCSLENSYLPFIPNYRLTQTTQRNQLINGDGFGVDKFQRVNS